MSIRLLSRLRLIRNVLSLALLVAFALPVQAQEPVATKPQEAGKADVAAREETPEAAAPAEAAIAEDDADSGPVVTVGKPTGITVTSADGDYSMHVWLRGQFRVTTPFGIDPRSPGDYASIENNPVNNFRVRRARLKIGGNAYKPWLDYYFEYDVVTGALLDLRLTFEKYDWLQFRVGQWKVNYNRERVDSSGKQQFAERSIVNREFTLDRQDGVMVMGRIAAGKPWDMRYFAGVFNGTGRLVANDDTVPMLFARLQWNIFGRDLAFSQTDVERTEKPTASLAGGTMSNTSRFTRFSGSGGSQIDGVDAVGEPGQFRVRQYLQEFAFKYQGLSIQQEYHWKHVEDRVNLTELDLTGFYGQIGYFFNELIPGVPEPLELAVRYATVDPDTSIGDNVRRELTFGANWFFAGHNNKLTADVSRLSLERGRTDSLSDTRFRLQWDVSF